MSTVHNQYGNRRCHHRPRLSPSRRRDAGGGFWQLAAASRADGRGGGRARGAGRLGASHGLVYAKVFGAVRRRDSLSQPDWCDEHNVPESMCVECNPKLCPLGKDYGWCSVHGVMQCPLEHPDIAQLKTPADHHAGDAGTSQPGDRIAAAAGE